MPDRERPSAWDNGAGAERVQRTGAMGLRQRRRDRGSRRDQPVRAIPSFQQKQTHGSSLSVRQCSLVDRPLAASARELCARLNSTLDAEIEANFAGGSAFRDTNGTEASAGRTQRFGGFIGPSTDPSSPFLELVDNPRVAAYLDGMLSSPRIQPGREDACSFRLDHMYLDLIEPPTAGAETTAGPIGTTLHKIGYPDAYYVVEEGRMYNGLLTVAYNLTDVDPALGGFACVPGSHRSALPGYFRDRASWKTLTEDAANNATVPEDVRRIGGAAGSAIIFTESLAHGTLPWRASHQRRTIFAKFNAHSTSYSSSYFDMTNFKGELSHREWQILMPPSARTDLGGLQRVVKNRNARWQEEDKEKGVVPEQQKQDNCQEEAMPEIGARAELHSLKTPQLNGQTGTVTGYAEDGKGGNPRVVVSLMSFDGRLNKAAVQRKNVRVIADAPHVDPRFSPLAAAKL